eukprot:CAMPEP_0172625116 /NCGR_PEP_ID=MMETSP1068-20121228/141595_1 /TAXON_ID=35684 /ORGANISM="Pseudopedinella elastica, Strain CCMP716" /LENGTH=36 /DNA_ID= /DNA_START= /DNA_END= /DNA_ORIENTATION=
MSANQIQDKTQIKAMATVHAVPSTRVTVCKGLSPPK